MRDERSLVSLLGFRRLVGAVLLFIWGDLCRFPTRLRERDFWVIQAGIAVVTGVHFATEITLEHAPWWDLHHLPVILYILPIAYASIKYKWEGGLLTSGWITLLVLPSVVLWHRENWMWLGEMVRVLVVIAVGVTLASRVEKEARLRRQAEASEARFRSLFEAAGDAILVYDKQGIIIAANEAAAPFFGVAAAHLLQGQHIDPLVPSWRRSFLHPPPRQNGVSNGPIRVQVRRVDGHPFTAEAVVSTLDDSAGDQVFQAVLRDATLQEMREKGLRSLVHQVTQAQEEERERIARELHDDTLQALILLTRELESLAGIPEVPQEVKTRLARMASLAANSGESLRRFSRDLRPSVLNDIGLVPAMEWLIEDLAKRTTLDACFRAEGVTRRLERNVELALFRIAQEALRNVEKHAHATRVEMVCSFESASVTLTISDNGLGFGLPSTLEEFVLMGKLGLVGLKERVSLLGGTIELQSTPGAGTKVSVHIPA